MDVIIAGAGVVWTVTFQLFYRGRKWRWRTALLACGAAGVWTLACLANHAA